MDVLVQCYVLELDSYELVSWWLCQIDFGRIVCLLVVVSPCSLCSQILNHDYPL